ncbi:cupin domain-containing protein [Comamonas sp. w2-DMI]|uniref:cupin domain-containing protein n=1 Tax=Comamonas sp. w2-DMI TaxID=3126391 RepID=UPI0032E3D7ED
MSYRRIVTGHDASGQSVFLSDATAARTTAFQHVPGFVTSLLWETQPDATIPASSGDDPAVAASSWVPGPNGTNLMFITFPPDSVMMSPGFDPMAAGGEYMQVLPGLAEKFEMENPGMHTTDTIDYGVLLDGEIHLELDNGAVKQLGRHDTVIQNGTRHAWRNTSDKPATMLFVLVGARRA